MNNPILEFIEDRKNSKLAKLPEKLAQLKQQQAEHPSSSLDKQIGNTEAKIADIEVKFQLRKWLKNAAGRAGQLTLTTHPGKFSHPNAKISGILSSGQKSNDGLVRTGNLNLQSKYDVFGNAAALDVFAFLNVYLPDGQSVLEHLDQQTTVIKNYFGLPEDEFLEMRNQFLKIKKMDDRPITNDGIKQVYFPVGQNEYHLLSVVHPSLTTDENNARIKSILFGEETKAAKDAKKSEKFHANGYRTFPSLLNMSFGGTKPQNVSNLNSQNGGVCYLLPSIPPTLAKRELRFPNRDFFKQLWPNDYARELFSLLHRFLTLDYNNLKIRETRQEISAQIANWIFEQARVLQGPQHAGWTDSESNKLPEYQRVWLDESQFERRCESDNWKQKIIKKCVRWKIDQYRRQIGNDAAKLGVTEEAVFQTEYESLFDQHEVSTIQQPEINSHVQ